MAAVVFKFGGTSVGSSANIRNAIEIIARECNSKKILVVVSAMGGVTDRLLLAASEAAKGNMAHVESTKLEFLSRHEEVISHLVDDPLDKSSLRKMRDDLAEEFSSICQSLNILRDHTSRIMDVTVARGERMMANLLCAALNSTGVNASFLESTEALRLKNDAVTPDMSISQKLTDEFLLPQFKNHDVIVVPGFIASSVDGRVVTLGRGGSDYSATLFASLIRAEEVCLYKEVDGILTADPHMVPKARIISEINYREATELAYYGAKILHPRTITPLLKEQIPLRIKNSFNPDFDGTLVSKEVNESQFPVKALTSVSDQSLVTIGGNGMIGVPGIAARVFGSIARSGISVTLISQASSEANICFMVSSLDAEGARHALELEFELELETKQLQPVEVLNQLAVVAVVGMGMKGNKGIAARTFQALARAKANVVAIAQGSSELNISFVIDDSKVEEALLTLHDEYRLHELNPIPKKHESDLPVITHGFGQIGRTLLNQMKLQKDYFEQSLAANLHPKWFTDRSGAIYFENDLSSTAVDQLIAQKLKGTSLIKMQGMEFEVLSQGDSQKIAGGIFVDLTAEETYDQLYSAVSNGMHVVLANKKPLAVDFEKFLSLQKKSQERGVHLRFEATVGAGLPVLDTIEKLENSGDTIHKILGCLSGSLGFIFTRMEEGLLFSDAVRLAYEKGFTEPDPREDLSGMDVARKALILSRRIGIPINMEDVSLTPLFSTEIDSDDPEEFLASLKKLDDSFNHQIHQASQKGRVLRYVARIEKESVKVGIEEVEAMSPLGGLRGTNNQISITTNRYHENPLIVTGPGAGAEVTAAGVLNDIVAIAAMEQNNA